MFGEPQIALFISSRIFGQWYILTWDGVLWLRAFALVKGMALLSRLQRKCFKTGIFFTSFPGNYFGSDANLGTWLFNWKWVGGKQGAEGKTALGSCPARGGQAGSAKSMAGPTPHLVPGFLTEVTTVWGKELEIHFLFLVLTWEAE